MLDRRILILRLFFSDTVFCNKAITMNSNLKIKRCVKWSGESLYFVLVGLWVYKVVLPLVTVVDELPERLE